MTSNLKALLTVTTLSTTGCAVLQSSAGHAVMDYILQAAALILTPIALLFVKRLVQAAEDHLGIKASEQQVSLIDNAVAKGVAYAEEQARKSMKLDVPIVVPDTDKLNMAVNFALDMLKQYDIADLGKDFLEKAVEAHLNLTRPFTDAAPAKKA
jgi:hypothetical protein